MALEAVQSFILFASPDRRRVWWQLTNSSAFKMAAWREVNQMAIPHTMIKFQVYSLALCVCCLHSSKPWWSICQYRYLCNLCGDVYTLNLYSQLSYWFRSSEEICHFNSWICLYNLNIVQVKHVKSLISCCNKFG